VLDGDMVAGHHDSFHEQPHESLAALEVEVVESRAQRGGEDLDVFPDALEAGAVHLVAGDLLDASAGCVAGSFKALAASL
jgi:hypothetical protein